MKHNKIQILIALIVLISLINTRSIFGQSITQNEKDIITESINIFFEKYSLFGSLSENGKILSSEYINEFKKLFQTEAIVYNDIEPGKNLHKTLSIKDYLKMIEQYYKNGLNVTISNVKAEKIKKINKDEYLINAILTKSVFGHYKSELIFRSTNKLKFNISAGRELGEYRIVSVKKTSGHHINVGIYLVPAFSNISSSGFVNSDNNYSGWTQSSNFVLDGKIEFIYSFSNLLGVGTGFGYSSYKIEQKVNTLHQSPYPTTDIDEDDFKLLVDTSNINNDVTVKYLDIPLFLYIQLNTKKVINYVYLKLGANISFVIESGYKISGSATHQGYYPQYHVLLYEIPELGFYNNKDFQYKDDGNLKSNKISALSSIGASVPIVKPELNLNFGFNILYGFTNISEEETGYVFSDKFGSYNNLMESRENLKTMSLGFEIGITYRIK